MCVCMVITMQSMDTSVKVVTPACSQLDMFFLSLSPFASENFVSRDRFDGPVLR